MSLNLAKAPRQAQRGLTLVELLVAMAIGLIVTLAVTSVVITGESHRRSTTSTNDMGQSGSFAIYQLDRAVRSAGSALVQSANNGVFGCKLNVGSILPRASAFPAPFADNFLQAGGTSSFGNLRVAPLLIGKSMSDDDVSDVLVIMRGNGNAGGVPRRISDPGTATLLKLESSIGFAVGDILLMSQPGVTDCLMGQIAALDPTASPGELTLNSSGNYYTAGTTTTAATLAGSTSTYVTALGTTSAGSVQFTMYGVGANNTLFSYDLLRTSGTTDASQAMADGVQELHAIYGLDTTGDGVLDAWAGPGDTGYDIGSVMTTPATLRQIVAVRVALVLKSATPESSNVTPTCDGITTTAETACGPYRYFTGFANAGSTSLQGEVNTSAAQKFRFRIVESTIPLRNMQLAPAPL